MGKRQPVGNVVPGELGALDLPVSAGDVRRNIRVMHLTTVHPRGDMRIFRKECRSLAASGYSVKLVVADGLGESTGTDVDVVDIGRVGGRLRRMSLQSWRAWGAARGSDAVIFHLHDPELLPVGLLLRLRGARVIYDAHEDLPRAILSKNWIRPGLRRGMARVAERFENFCAGQMSAVIAATPHIAKRFARVNRRSVAVNNFPLEEELLAPLSGRREPRTVCYVGGIGLIRGAREMVRALEFVDAKLVLAGLFEGPETEAAVRALPGWNSVEYRGFVSREDARAIYNRSMAGLIFFHPEPNHVEAQPNKIFEYMAAGLPVLASDFPLWRRILDESGAGRCADPLDARAIARVIQEVLADGAAALEMGERGRRAVGSRYRWKSEERKLLALYAELLAAA